MKTENTAPATLQANAKASVPAGAVLTDARAEQRIDRMREIFGMH